MRITLTEKQIRQLGPFFDRVNLAAALGAPGMLVAQIRCDSRDHKYWMEPGFLDHQHALCITEKGQHCSLERPPTTPEGNTEDRFLQSAPGEPADKPGSVALVSQSQDSCA
jgi:hypothetical protein